MSRAKWPPQDPALRAEFIANGWLRPGKADGEVTPAIGAGKCLTLDDEGRRSAARSVAEGGWAMSTWNIRKGEERAAAREHGARRRAA